MAALPLADRWFERQRIDDSLTLIWEPHVIPLMRCNIWHVRGRDRDLVIDTGLGVGRLTDELADLLDRPVVAVATHGHDDHIGGHAEFAESIAHAAEAHLLEDPPMRSLSPIEAWGQATVDAINRSGYRLDDPWFVTALPAGVSLESFRHHPAPAVRRVVEGDVIDIGDRAFEVLHLPGHSPGSIGLWEAGSGTLFSGDAIYDGPLLDELADSNIEDYVATMERLVELPVSVVHGGHDPSFGRERLIELATTYLAHRRPT